jgi:hypothetical protein
MVANTATAGVLGTWSITWDWSQGDGGHGTAPITFSKGHIYEVTQESGKWTKHGKHLTLHFGSSNSCHGTWKAIYQKTMGEYVGTMASTCHGAGVWSMTR